MKKSQNYLAGFDERDSAQSLQKGLHVWSLNCIELGGNRKLFFAFLHLGVINMTVHCTHLEWQLDTFSHRFTCESITPVEVMSISVTPQSPLRPLCHSSPLPISACLTCLQSTSDRLSDITEESAFFLEFYISRINHIVCAVSCLAFFTLHNYSEIHPCFCLYQ